ncbi:MAG TPA: hypothetical protein VGB70_12670 [Allosphingosinicella sp.]|jgi:hypothetical protein
MGLRTAVLGLLTIGAAASAEAQTADAPLAVQQPSEALVEDARFYARQNGIPLVEAIARLRAQEESAAITDAIRNTYAGRFVGIALEHQPDFRIVVLLTGSDPVADQVVSAGGLGVPIHFKTGALASREQLVTAIEQHQAAIRASLKGPPGMGVDPRTGELVVVVGAADLTREGEAALDRRFEALTGVPVRIRPQGLEHADAAAGGARLEGPQQAGGGRAVCTTGFVVTDGSRTAIATAAHCPDVLSYRDGRKADEALRFLGQWGWRFRDVQLHESNRAEQPLFFADPAKGTARRLAGWRNRTSTRAGDTVCHQGESSGYSCSQVELTDYAPPGDLCGGPCAPTWITVRGPSCKGGDSGGPVFLGATAFGMLKGASYAASGRCDFYYYMSTDYLPDGWALLR